MPHWPRVYHDYDGDDPLISRTWQINTTLARTITLLADDYQVTHSSLIRLLLTHALDDIAAGRLEIVREPVLWRALLRGGGGDG